MKKKGAGENSSIRTFIRGAYKGTSHKYSEFVARLLGTKDESWGLVVFERGIAKEIAEAEQ